MISSSTTKPTLSIVIPALDEEAHIADAVRETLEAARDRFADYEIILVNDGSRDRTGAIMDELAVENPRLMVLHNTRPRNLGGAYKQAVALARFDYLVMIPGDNENPSTAMRGPFDAIGRADLVIPYPTNPQRRSLARTLMSAAYVRSLNALFGLNLRYYNGTVIHRTADLRAIAIETDSFAYQSEILVKLINAGKSYVEVGIEIDPKKDGRRSGALRPGNIAKVICSMARLALQVRGKRRSQWAP